MVSQNFWMLFMPSFCSVKTKLAHSAIQGSEPSHPKECMKKPHPRRLWFFCIVWSTQAASRVHSSIWARLGPLKPQSLPSLSSISILRKLMKDIEIGVPWPPHASAHPRQQTHQPWVPRLLDDRLRDRNGVLRIDRLCHWSRVSRRTPDVQNSYWFLFFSTCAPKIILFMVSKFELYESLFKLARSYAVPQTGNFAV